MKAKKVWLLKTVFLHKLMRLNDVYVYPCRHQILTKKSYVSVLLIMSKANKIVLFIKVKNFGLIEILFLQRKCKWPYVKIHMIDKTCTYYLVNKLYHSNRTLNIAQYSVKKILNFQLSWENKYSFKNQTLNKYHNVKSHTPLCKIRLCCIRWVQSLLTLHVYHIQEHFINTIHVTYYIKQSD